MKSFLSHLLAESNIADTRSRAESMVSDFIGTLNFNPKGMKIDELHIMVHTPLTGDKGDLLFSLFGVLLGKSNYRGILNVDSGKVFVGRATLNYNKKWLTKDRRFLPDRPVCTHTHASHTEGIRTGKRSDPLTWSPCLPGHPPLDQRLPQPRHQSSCRGSRTPSWFHR